MTEFRNEYEEAAFKRGREGLIQTITNMLTKKFSDADILELCNDPKALDEAKRRLKLC